MTNLLVNSSRFFRYLVFVSSLSALLLLSVSPQIVYAQSESCDSTLQNTLNRVSEMRRVAMEWYSEAIFSLGVGNASIELQPRTAAANTVSDQAFAIYYGCKNNDRTARGDSDADRIDAVIDNAQVVSEHSLPGANHRAFSAGSEILRHTWKRQFEQLTKAFDSTNDWGKGPSGTSFNSGIGRYQSRIFSKDSAILQNSSDPTSLEVDSESTAYLEQLESVSDSFDDIIYNEITTRSNDIGTRREQRREIELETYRREHERLMRDIEAVGNASSSRQSNAGSGATRASGSGCPSKSQAAAIRARGGTPTCQ